MLCKNSDSAEYCSAGPSTLLALLKTSQVILVSVIRSSLLTLLEKILFSLIFWSSFVGTSQRHIASSAVSPHALSLSLTSAPFHGRPKGFCWTWNVSLLLSLLCHELNREQVCLGQCPVQSSCHAKDRQTHTICCFFLLLALSCIFMHFLSLSSPSFIYRSFTTLVLRDADHGVWNAVFDFLFKCERNDSSMC